MLTSSHSDDRMFGSFIAFMNIIWFCGGIGVLIFGIRVKQGKTGHMEILSRGTAQASTGKK